jgi:hypothetical protein
MEKGEEAMILTRNEIVERMERLGKAGSLRFNIPDTFGGGMAVVALNPAGGEKKYVLYLGKDEKAARESPPYWEQDKAKLIAKWINDRVGEWLE